MELHQQTNKVYQQSVPCMHVYLVTMIISNYHPVSLSCIILKVIEKIILKAKLLFATPHQFGFLTSCSTYSNY